MFMKAVCGNKNTITIIITAMRSLFKPFSCTIDHDDYFHYCYYSTISFNEIFARLTLFVAGVTVELHHS